MKCVCASFINPIKTLINKWIWLNIDERVCFSLIEMKCLTVVCVVWHSICHQLMYRSDESSVHIMSFTHTTVTHDMILSNIISFISTSSSSVVYLWWWCSKRSCLNIQCLVFLKVKLHLHVCSNFCIHVDYLRCEVTVRLDVRLCTLILTGDDCKRKGTQSSQEQAPVGDFWSLIVLTGLIFFITSYEPTLLSFPASASPPTTCMSSTLFTSASDGNLLLSLSLALINAFLFL